MTRKARAKKPTIHCLKWLRKELGITQAQLAKRIGVSKDYIQSLESGRLVLSEKTAFALAAETGVHPHWFIRNQLKKPLPNVAEHRKSLERKIYASGGYYERQLSQRMILFRAYLFDRTIATELGWVACYASGFNERVKEGLEQRLAGFRTHNPRAYQEVKAQAEALVNGDGETVARLVLADAQEVLQAMRARKPKKETPTPNSSSASAHSSRKK